ncbi:DUF5106 domain-containing protein [Aureispira anguillae]|uniref:DUF5106 domain-containing protein n=1 Tax=Aureispira anguillae TaxID=2864201 RepID=A0A915YFX0_9BACT|nr:DUF5106 domain-containing protein [Aureispira anguillae]BDS12285.1 DUF5106 domain-containing protein [Aureispira anguillae]
MNQLLRRSILFVLIAWASFATAQDGYNIRVKIDGYKNDTCILGYRLGKKTYVKDTLTSRNNKGEWLFKGDESLKGGIYLILTKPENLYFEFLVSNKEDQKKMFLSTKLDGNRDLSKHLKIEGSADNKVFLDYLKFLADTRAKDGKVAKEIEAEKNPEKKKKLQEERVKIGASVKTYQLALIEKNPDYLSAKLIAASMQPEVPKTYTKAEGFYYFRAHYWDNFDWTDARLIRTPIFKDKIEFWTEKLAVKTPDSVITAVDFILQKLLEGGNKEMFQYAAAELLNKYAQTKVICMDAVYVFLGEKYYCAGHADWVDSAQLEKICENVRTLKPLQCGLYAPNIRLKKMDGTPVNLHEVQAKFVALYFWDPDCGNCSKTTDKLVPVYNKYKDMGFEIFGVCSKNWKEIDKCKAKIKDKGMDFINTSDEAYPLAVAKKIYDIKVNPYLVLLDEDKKIMFKRLDPKQLEDILKRGFETKEDPNVDKAVEEEFKKKEKANEAKLKVNEK